MKPDVIDDRDKFMRRVDRAEEMMPYCSRCSKLVQWMEGYVIFSSSVCPKQFHTVKKSIPQTKITRARTMLSTASCFTVFRQ